MNDKKKDSVEIIREMKEVVFMKTDVVTGNQRLYPKDVIEKAVKDIDKLPVYSGQDNIPDIVDIIGESSMFKINGNEVSCSISIHNTCKVRRGFPALRGKGAVDYRKDGVQVVTDLDILSVDLVQDHSDKSIPMVVFNGDDKE